METIKITKEEKRHVRIESLADKYSCSREYVRRVLCGDAPLNTILSQKLIADARDIIAIVERETKVTV